MPDLNTPYVEASPGDLITSEKWNDMQRRIRKDIGDKTQEAVDRLTRVQNAGNSDKLEGKSLSELTDELVRRAVQEIRSESGYRQLFKVLRGGEDNLVKHGLGLFPLVDLYQLDYFQVVCCEDKDTYPTWTTFYLHHEDEDRMRYAVGDKRGSLSIQPERGPEYKLKLSWLLSRYKVRYDDDSSLSDVESGLWQALFADPNDLFGDDQRCHSPWFDKCCREEKTVGEARKNGDWDDLYVQFRARKTVNFPTLPAKMAKVEAKPVPEELDEIRHVHELERTSPIVARLLGEAGTLDERRRRATGIAKLFPKFRDNVPDPAPTNVEVSHYDLDTLTLRLLSYPSLPEEWFDENQPAGSIEKQIPDVRRELKLMVLLKV